MDIKFNSDGLVVAIATYVYTNSVLMQAYMNREALEKTLETGQTYYYSRSRQALWHKGETSGHYQKVVDIYTDCDCDSILLRVIQTGNACHTGAQSCFFNKLKEFSYFPDINIIQKIFNYLTKKCKNL